jgi:hypothetical protein
LKKVKDSIWLFIKNFVWICRITMGRKRLKKVCCDQEVQKQNVATSELASRKPEVDETSSQCN